MIGAAPERGEPAPTPDPEPDPDSTRIEIERLRLEVERLKAERAQLQTQLADRRAGASPSRRMRRSFVAVLAALCCVLVFLSAMTVWIHQTVISTSGFVKTFGPIVDRPAVTEAMSVQITNQIFGAVDVGGQVKQALPAQGKFLAAPLANAAQSFVEDQVAKVLGSPQFRAVWITVLRATHSEVIGALRGQSDVLAVSNGAVVLNVLPLVDVALQHVQSAAPGLLGRSVTIPKITSGELPPEIRASLSHALGVNLPADFGQIELARASSIDVAKKSVQVLDVLFWLLPLLTLLGIVTTVWLSTNRRRTLLQVLVGTGVALIVAQRAAASVQSRIVSAVDQANRPAADDIIRQVFHGLILATRWVLVIALIAAALLLLTGPYRWARRLRTLAGRAANDFARSLARRTGDQSAGAWVARHNRAMQGGGAVVGALLLWVAPGWWFVVVAVALAAYEVAVWKAGRYLKDAPPDETDGSRPAEQPAAGPLGPTR